eukprot:jgi/Botrbrau1/1907/Bobra.0005s0022.1
MPSICIQQPAGHLEENALRVQSDGELGKSLDLSSRGLNKQCAEYLWDVLLSCSWISGDGHSTEESLDSTNIRIDYEGFCKAAAICRENGLASLESYFSASNFLRCQPDAAGMVLAADFRNFVLHKEPLLQMRSWLLQLDQGGTGMLEVTDLEKFLDRVFPEVAGTSEQEGVFTWRRLAASKLMFFCGHRGRAKIVDILSSDLLMELLDLCQLNVTQEVAEMNAFSPTTLLDPLRGFESSSRNMVVDADGLHSWSGGALTPLFISRLLGERSAAALDPACTAAERGMGNCMNTLSFIWFTFAWSRRDHPAAVRYFFPIFDIESKGYISQMDMYMFLKEVHGILCRIGYAQPLRLEDMMDEAIAMINAKNPHQITLKDLLDSNMAGTFIGILANVQVFWMYEERDRLVNMARC